MMLNVKSFCDKSLKFGLKNSITETDKYPLVKKIIKLVISVILAPFKLIKNTYDKFFVADKQKSFDVVASFCKKNRSTIIKIAAALSGVLVFGYSINNLSIQKNNSSQPSLNFNNLSLKENFISFCAILVYLYIENNKNKVLPKFESEEPNMLHRE